LNGFTDSHKNLEDSFRDTLMGICSFFICFANGRSKQNFRNKVLEGQHDGIYEI
jgi:hypothetical protein